VAGSNPGGIMKGESGSEESENPPGYQGYEAVPGYPSPETYPPPPPRGKAPSLLWYWLGVGS
ncbi:hypothetical protein KI387_017419, partial [Taxus chinensis]